MIDLNYERFSMGEHGEARRIATRYHTREVRMVDGKTVPQPTRLRFIEPKHEAATPAVKVSV